MWKRLPSIGTVAWTAKTEEAVIEEFKQAGVEAVLVAFDIESVTGAPPCSNEYVAEAA